MTKFSLTFLLSILSASLTLTVFAEIQPNKQPQQSLSYKNVLIPEAPPVASVMAAYFDVVNHTNKKQTITHVESPQFQNVEIHSMTMKDGIMRMKEFDSLSIKPKETFSLESAGLHLMLIRPTKRLKKGDQVILKLKLASGEINTIDTKVTFSD